MVSVIESLFTQNQTLVSFSCWTFTAAMRKKDSENISFEHRAHNKGMRTLLSVASTASIPKLSYMMMNIRLLSLPLVCFVMKFAFVVNFYSHSREKGSAGMRKTTKAIKKCSSALRRTRASSPRSESLLNTSWNCTYIAESGLPVWIWRDRGRTMVVSQLKIEEMKMLRRDCVALAFGRSLSQTKRSLRLSL